MLRMSLMAGGVALCLAGPAFAQGTTNGPSQNTTNPMSSSDTSAMTCDQIMRKVNKMSTSAPGATRAHKRNEMIAARAALAKNDEAGCKMHATRALQIMMYGT